MQSVIMVCHARIQNIFSGGGGVQIPRRGLTEIFNMAKINNLAIPGGGPDPLSPPLDPPMYVSLICNDIMAVFYLKSLGTQIIVHVHNFHGFVTVFIF